MRICDYKFAVYGFFAQHNGAAMLAEVAHTTDRVGHFAPLINALTDEQAESVLAMLKGLVNSNRAIPKKTVQPVQEKPSRKFRVEEDEVAQH
jgi:hypothetical protein